MKNIEINRVSNGQFEVLVNGEQTKYRIVNGSAGLSGLGGNQYGIFNAETEKYTWLRSLALCKKTVKVWINKE